MAVCVAGYSLGAEEWGTDLPQGLATAAAEGRPVLVEFTGSDWCPPCMIVRSKYLPTKEFKDFVEKNKLVLVELDYPQGANKVSPEVRRERDKIATAYQINAFPTMLVLDAQGRPYAKVEGAATSAQAYVARLQAAMEQKSEIESKLAAAEGLSGTALAHALAAVFRLMPDNIQALHAEIEDKIIQNDPADETGIRKAKEENALCMKLFAELDQTINEKLKGETGATQQEMMLRRMRIVQEELLAMLGREGLPPMAVQRFCGVLAQSYMAEKRVDEAITYMEKAIAAAPERPEVPALREKLEQWKRISASQK